MSDIFTFSIWLTALSPYYASNITFELVKRGYNVSKLGDGSGDPLTTPGNPAALIPIKVIGAPKPPTSHTGTVSAGMMLAVMKEIIAQQKIQFYSIVVHSSDGSSSWNIGNIDLKKVEAVSEKKKIDNEIEAALYGRGA